MTKKVEYNGKTYKITTVNYAFTSQRLIVNGEPSNIKMNNDNLDDVNSWKIYAKRAIEEYNRRYTARKEFEKWDGKL